MDSKYEVIVTERAKQELQSVTQRHNYVAIFRIDKKERKVYIVRIIYGGRNYLNEL